MFMEWLNLIKKIGSNHTLMCTQNFEKKTKNDFERQLCTLMNNSVFGKTMEDVCKHREIKLDNKDERRNHLVPEPNYHATNWF